MTQGRRGSRESGHDLSRRVSDRGRRVSESEMPLCFYVLRDLLR